MWWISSLGEIVQSDAMPINEEAAKITYTQIEDCPGVYDEYLFNGANWMPKNPSPSELKKIGKPYLLNGIQYQVPLDKDAQDTVAAIHVQFITGIILNEPIEIDTIINFTNGTDMPITNSDWLDFATWFGDNRRQFFRITNEI